MPTRFGRFITGKTFPKLFMIVYIMLCAVTAHCTAWALYTIGTARWICFSIYFLFAAAGVLILNRKKYHSVLARKGLSFLRCIAIYYSMLFLVSAVIGVMPFISEFMRAICILVPLPMAILFVVVGFMNTRTIEHKEYNLKLNEKGQLFRIAMISDIHMGLFVRSKHVMQIVQNIKQLSPDLILFAGDLFDVDQSILDDKEELNRISRIFRGLNAGQGVYAVLGNHDPNKDDPRLMRFLKDAGIHLLDNEEKVLQKITLVGRTDERNNKRIPWEEIAISASGKPLVVIDHRPQGIEEAAEHGASIVLSGHTHRGQFFPITIFTKLANGKRYFYGLNKIRDTYGITTSGVGYFELPIRLGTRNEIVDIRLKV